MGNSENKIPGSAESNDDLAKDIARLYSWANVEGASYRDFSRPLKPRHIRAQQGSEENESESSNTLQPGAESQPQAPEFVTAASETGAPAIHPVADHIFTDAVLPPTNPPVAAPMQGLREKNASTYAENASSALAIYSLAGGVGKTTFCASLGRILCSLGERVLLVDASVSGLLPFYFGAADLRPGLRTFLAPEPDYPPLQVIGTDEVTSEWLEGDVKTSMRQAQRTIFDLGPASQPVLSEILALCGIVLIPLLPDLNSILTVSRIEASLQAMKSKGISAPPAFYLFNRFDEKDPTHQQARGLVERQCGEQLLPVTVRSDTEVAAAIASRMTVVDRAPEAGVTRDFIEVASWVRKVAPIQVGGRAPGRWSER
jgi:cellulose synthase operon protein YhjQ